MKMLTHFVTNITFLSDPLVHHCNVRFQTGSEVNMVLKWHYYHLNSGHLVVKTFPQ